MKFLISLFLIINIYAQVIDKIEILVNNTPITTYDIQKTEALLGINKQQAISYLIDKAILTSAIKKRNIYVDDFDIDNEMEKIAHKNGMSLYNFKNYLLQKGELVNLKEQIKENLEKEKLLKTLNIQVTKKEIENYYNNHKNEFMLPSKIEVTEYSSINRQTLQNTIKNPLLNTNNDVSTKDITFDINHTNPNLMKLLAKVKTNSFSPIINTGKKFVSFYVIKKYPKTPLPLNIAINEIYPKLLIKQQNIALKDFISKLRAKADIKFLN